MQAHVSHAGRVGAQSSAGLTHTAAAADLGPTLGRGERYYKAWLADTRNFGQPAEVAAVCWKVR